MSLPLWAGSVEPREGASQRLRATAERLMVPSDECWRYTSARSVTVTIGAAELNIHWGRSYSVKGFLRAAAALAIGTAVSLGSAAAEPPQDESARIADWRAQRLASLTSETGWLTPVALYWLKDGENSFGRSADRAFSLDDAVLPPDTGVFVLRDRHVQYVAHAPAALTYLGQPVTHLDLVSDAGERPTEMVAGSLHFLLIERAGRLGIRVRDSVSPNRAAGRPQGRRRVLQVRAPGPPRQRPQARWQLCVPPAWLSFAAISLAGPVFVCAFSLHGCICTQA